MPKIKTSTISPEHLYLYLFKPCEIEPLEFLKGVIVAINHSKKGTELQVRYFIDGEYRVEWFFDFDLVVYYDTELGLSDSKYEEKFYALMPLISEIYNRMGGFNKIKGLDYKNIGLYKIDKLESLKSFLLNNIKYRSKNYDLCMTNKSKVYDEILDKLGEIEL